MATGISWADETWNPVVGCTPVSPGCRLCYAARTALRLGRMPALSQYRGVARQDLIGRPAWSGLVRTVPAALQAPYRWARPRVVFLGSMSDVFHERVPDAYLDRIWDVIEDTDHIYLVLTKRPERMRRHLARRAEVKGAPWNVWAGTSVEAPAQVNRLEPLLECRPYARAVFLSLEPLLESLAVPLEVALRQLGRRVPRHREVSSLWHEIGEVDWVIAGGESGPGARSMAPAWPREIRDMCARQHIPFHFKQWGPPRLGRVLDGVTWDACPPAVEVADMAEIEPPARPCRTCATVPAVRHNRCRGCLGRLRRVGGG